VSVERLRERIQELYRDLFARHVVLLVLEVICRGSLIRSYRERGAGSVPDGDAVRSGEGTP
jgi:hypothetical protein